MNWTAEQEAILAHPLGAHAVVRAAPGAGKTTTLVGRVRRLIDEGADPTTIRVVMFNKSIQETFRSRLDHAGVRVSTFDALGLEVLRVADRKRLLSKPLRVDAEGTSLWAREIFREYRDQFETAEEIADAVTFWKAHLVPPKKAFFAGEAPCVEAYERFEALRLDGDELRVAFEDMVYTAVGVLGRHPRLLGRIDHVLVDEFQDVNPARVELLRRLMHAGTAIMAVGDEDQGINEWCGAHPRFLREFASTFPNLPVRSYLLSRSFRFGATLATAANQVIRHNVGRLGGQVVGGGPTPGAAIDCADPGETVRKLVASGVSPQDIAVLYRGRTQAAPVIAALAIDRVPMRTDDVGLLRKGRGPELAIGYLHQATTDQPSRFEDAWPIVFGPDRYIQKEAFSKQMASRRPLRTILRDREGALRAGQNRRAVASMQDLAHVLDRMGRCATAGKALDILLEEVDVEDQLRTRLRSEKETDMAISSFHAVHALVRGLGVTPAEAANAVASIDPTAGQPIDACVWVSTIHKAKGLEWRHVVLPGLIEGACPAERRGTVPGTVDAPDGVPQSPWMEQERRIFYVGLTRAIETAHLHAPGSTPSRFLAELRGLQPVTTGRASLQTIVGVLTHQEGLAPTASGRRWTQEDDELLEEGWEAGETSGELALKLGRSVSAIAARLVRLGIVDTREEARARI